MTSDFAQVELIQGLLLAFALVVILMSPYIRLLHALGFGKRIRQEGPESHYQKEGTPTMGGLLIIAVVIGIYFFLRSGPDASTFAPLAALAGVGVLGAFDDYLNARTGEGIRVRQKLVWQTVVAFVAAWQIQQTYAIDQIAVPFVGRCRSTRGSTSCSRPSPSSPPRTASTSPTASTGCRAGRWSSRSWRT